MNTTTPNSSLEEKCCALIVTFRPDVKILQDQLRALQPQVKSIYIFDNSENEAANWRDEIDPLLRFELHGINKNIGIAGAQNHLLTLAKKAGYAYGLLCDQDTIFPERYVPSLVAVLLTHTTAAAACPGWINTHEVGPKTYRGQYVYDGKRLRIERQKKNVFTIAHAISSGMLIRLSTLDEIGLMRSDLFIDWVDNEWCWRAAAKGYIIVATPHVLIEHRLGDSVKLILGRPFVTRPTARNYFIIRNALYLATHERLPLAIRNYLIKKSMHHALFSFLASRSKPTEVKAIVRAMIDALRKKLGPYR